jgi:hypothetical protein
MRIIELDLSRQYSPDMNKTILVSRTSLAELWRAFVPGLRHTGLPASPEPRVQLPALVAEATAAARQLRALAGPNAPAALRCRGW